MNGIHRQILRIAPLGGAAVFVFGLGLFAAAGYHARLWADDFCYSAAVKQSGLLRGAAEWYQSSGNRLSTLLPVAISDLFGAAVAQFIPLAMILVWAAALFFFFRELSRMLGNPARAVWLLVLALGLAYYVVLLAPDRLQTVYWRMGVFHYSLPVPLMLVNLGLILRGLREKTGLAWRALLAGLLAFFAAGLSETGAAMQVGVLLTGLALALLFLDSAERRRGAVMLGAGLVGTLLMMAVMSQAPANAWRQDAMPPPENPLVILPVSLRFAADFVYYSLRGKPTAFLAFGLLVFSVGLLGFSPAGDGQKRLPMRWLAGALLSLLAGYAWIVFSFAPSVFAGLQYPAGRAQMPGHFALLAGLGGAAFFAAQAARIAWGERRASARTWLALGLFLLACLYPFRAAPVSQQDAAQLSIRAERWDARAAEIRAAAGSGRGAQVRQIDVVQGLEDIGPDPAFWINRCAAVYFDVATITANP